MADFVLDIDYNITKAQAKQQKLDAQLLTSKNKVKELKNKITEATAEIEKLKETQSDLSEDYKNAVNEAYRLETVIDRINSGKASIQEIIDAGGLDNVTSQYNAQIEKIKSINLQYEKTEHNIKKQEALIGRTNAQIISEEANMSVIGSKIKDNTNKTEKLNKTWEKVNKKVKSTQGGVARVGKRIKSLIASALFFTLITKAFTNLRETFGEIIKKDEKLMKHWQQIKSNALSIGFQLYDIIRPALDYILPIIISITSVLSNLLYSVFGKGARSAKQIAASMSDTAKSAEKTTAAFDTLQTAKNSESSTEQLNTGLTSIGNKNILGKYLDPLKDYDLSPLIASLGKIREQLKPMKETLFSGLEYFYYNALVPIGEWVVESYLPNFFSLFASTLELLNKVIEIISPSLNSFYEEVIKPIGEWIGDFAVGVIQDVKDGISRLTDLLEDKKEQINNILTAVKDVVVFIWGVIKPILNEIRPMVRGIIDFVIYSIGDVIDFFG